MACNGCKLIYEYYEGTGLVASGPVSGAAGGWAGPAIVFNNNSGDPWVTGRLCIEAGTTTDGVCISTQDGCAQDEPCQAELRSVKLDLTWNNYPYTASGIVEVNTLNTQGKELDCGGPPEVYIFHGATGYGSPTFGDPGVQVTPTNVIALKCTACEE